MKKLDSRRDVTRAWQRGHRVALSAAGVNLAILFLGRAAGVPFLKPAWDGSTGLVPVSPAEVVTVSLVSVLAGIKLAKVVARKRPSRLRLVQGLGAFFALMSLGGPLSLQAADATKLLLASMHLVCGAIYVAYLQSVIASAGLGVSASSSPRVDPPRTLVETA